MKTEADWIREDYEIVCRDARRMRFYIEECLNADEVRRLRQPRPTEAQEAYWAKRGWSADGFGTWAPPGYHILRPGKTQANDYSGGVADSGRVEGEE